MYVPSLISNPIYAWCLHFLILSSLKRSRKPMVKILRKIRKTVLIYICGCLVGSKLDSSSANTGKEYFRTFSGRPLQNHYLIREGSNCIKTHLIIAVSMCQPLVHFSQYLMDFFQRMKWGPLIFTGSKKWQKIWKKVGGSYCVQTPHNAQEK